MPKKQFDKYDNFVEKVEDIIQWVYNHTINLYLDKKERKCKIRIDKYDTWNMDNTLALIIVPMLKQLKETQHGYHLVDNEDIPDELKTDEDYDEFKWNYVLDEMIFAFESSNEDWENQFYSGTMDKISVPVDKKGNEIPEDEAILFEWRDGPNHTFKVDYEGRNKYIARIKNGHRLFGKYYMSLWD